MKPRKLYWSIVTFRANMKFNMSYWEYFTPGCNTPCSSKRGTGCKLSSATSNTNSITNKLTKKSCLTSGGKWSTTDTIYAAKCTKHNLIYVGHSSQKLSGRFNSHSSDVKVKPNACELSQHFHESKNCKIEKELKVYILQNNATGTREKREFIENRWINTKSPNGMSSDLKGFAKTFYT